MSTVIENVELSPLVNVITFRLADDVIIVDDVMELLTYPKSFICVELLITPLGKSAVTFVKPLPSPIKNPPKHITFEPDTVREPVIEASPDAVTYCSITFSTLPLSFVVTSTTLEIMVMLSPLPLTTDIEPVPIKIFPILTPPGSPFIEAITTASFTKFNDEVVIYKSLQGLVTEPKSCNPFPEFIASGIIEPDTNCEPVKWFGPVITANEAEFWILAVIPVIPLPSPLKLPVNEPVTYCVFEKSTNEPVPEPDTDKEPVS